MKGTIFINYRKDDSPWNSVALYQELIKHFPAKNIFKDFNTIVPGTDFVASIEKALDECNVLLALISDHWLTITDAGGNKRIADKEDFVRLEIATALKRNITVIPVLFDNATMPQADDLPDDLKKLAHRQFIKIDKTRFEEDTARLVKVIKKALPQNPLLKKGVMTTAALILVIAGYFFLRPPERGATGPVIPTDTQPADSPEFKVSDTVGTSGVQPAAVQEMHVSFSANPYTVKPGGEAALSVLAYTTNNIPVPNASVKMSCGGGWFSGSSTGTELGVTNANGVFTTRWRSPDPAASGYGISVEVTKEGYYPGKQDIIVHIGN